MEQDACANRNISAETPAAQDEFVKDQQEIASWTKMVTGWLAEFDTYNVCLAYLPRTTNCWVNVGLCSRIGGP